jgi:DnaK suppressor protein
MVKRKVLESVRGQLVERMEDLQQAIGRTTVHMKETSGNRADFVDQATTEHDQTLELTIRSRESDQVREIRETLLRIDRGQFGICLRCGKPISQKRLLLAPLSRFCAPCKTNMEFLQNQGRSYGAVRRIMESYVA